MKVTLDIPEDFDERGCFIVIGESEGKQVKVCEKMKLIDKFWFTDKGKENIESYKDALKRRALHSMCDVIWTELLMRDIKNDNARKS